MLYKLYRYLFGDTTSSIYLRGRRDGCKAIEKMVLSRAKDKGYNVDKIWEDLLQ